MNIIELSKYLQDEQAAEEYLYDKWILKRFTTCPHCESDKIGYISRGRIKCYKCKKEWHKRKDSFLEGKQISFSKFIAFIKLYADEVGVNQIADELELDIKSVITIHSGIRNCLINTIIPTSLDESTTAILLEDHGKLRLLFSQEKESQITGQHYFLEFERYKEFGSLYSFLIKSRDTIRGQHKYNSLDRFISFAKMKLLSYRGIKIQNLKEYLVELLIMYNNSENDWYTKVLNSLHFARVVNIPVS